VHSDCHDFVEAVALLHDSLDGFWRADLVRARDRTVGALDVDNEVGAVSDYVVCDDATGGEDRELVELVGPVASDAGANGLEGGGPGEGVSEVVRAPGFFANLATNDCLVGVDVGDRGCLGFVRSCQNGMLNVLPPPSSIDAICAF
jgi:hypothetical protein